MAQGRMLSKASSEDEALNRCSLEAHLLYVQTLPHLDRDGLVTGRPLLLWRLAIARERRVPSVREREVVARDFSLPVGVEWTVAERVARGRKFRPGAKLWVAECRWWEEERTQSAEQRSETDERANHCSGE